MYIGSARSNKTMNGTISKTGAFIFFYELNFKTNKN